MSGVVGRQYRMAGRAGEAITEGREWSACPPSVPGVVVRLSWRAGSGQEALTKHREALPKGREWLGGPHGVSRGPSKGQGVVGRPSRRVGSGQEAFLGVREWSEDLPEGPRVVGRPSERAVCGRVTFTEGH